MEFFQQFWWIFWQLLKGYWTFGLPFLLAHLGVITFIIYDTWYRKIRRETNALQQWNPQSDQNQPNSEYGEATRILDQFTEECGKLGPQGYFVPMTDFSDRLDSIIDGMVAELHDRTNLLLIVGIAGTLFGVFEFAFRANDVMSNTQISAGDQVQALGKFLSASMAKAFPVGFMGLILTLSFQIWAAFPEWKLRDALAKATRKALRRREEKSRSQAEIVRQAAEAIKQAMQPLSDLKDTLDKSIQPVVTEFGQRLDQSLSLVQIQFDKLQETTRSVHQAVESVETGVTSLKTVADSLKALLQNAPEVLQNIIRLQGHQQASLQEFDNSLKEHLGQARLLNLSLTDTAQSLNELPKEIIRETQSALHSLGEGSLSVWQNMSKEFADKLYSDYELLLNGVGTRAQEVKEAATAVLQELGRVAENTNNATRALTELPNSIRTETKEAFGNLSDESLKAWQKMSDEYGREVQSQYIKYLAAVQAETEKITTSLQGASTELHRIGQSSDMLLRVPIEQAIRNVRTEISEDFRNLNQVLAERYPQVSQDVQTFTDNLRVLLGQVQEMQGALTVWLQDAQKAQSKVHDIHESLVVADLLQKNIEQLQDANKFLEKIQNQMPPSGDGIQAELQRSIRLLSEIRIDIDHMTNKERWFDWIIKRRRS